MRGLLPLLACVALAPAQEVNPVRPKATVLLADRARCIAFAEEVAVALRKNAAATKEATVYSGHAGVALFFFSLHRVTKKEAWLEAGRRALDQALAKGMETGAGLYTGVAGIGQVCIDAWRATGDAAWLEKARRCAARIKDHETTDIIYGAAGAGVFLLNLHAATKDERYLAAARKAGDFLARTAVRKQRRASWTITPGRSATVYVGLSHGAAGIGYFLLHLHRATGEKSYRVLAEEAARFVLAHAIEEGGDGYHWERTVPPTRNDTIRIQWCHGAPGMGLFFCDMHRHLGGDAYRKALLRCVATTRRLGRTARTSGCQCHGVSGNAELFLEAHTVLKDPALLESARAFGSALLDPVDGGFAVRVRNYQPSYMVGLAGIGHFFLRLGDPKNVVLPMTVTR